VLIPDICLEQSGVDEALADPADSNEEIHSTSRGYASAR
jgi:hypothetical protein